MNTSQILKEHLDKTRNDLIGSYRAKGLKASGSAENLIVDVANKGFETVGKIAGGVQWYHMQNGRKPNKKKTKGQIYFLYKILQVWAEQKGIQINEWLAAKKIVEKGIQVPNRHNPGGVISDVINDKWLEELNVKLRNSVVEEYKSIITRWQ